MTHYMLAAKDFSSRTLKALARQGLFVTGCQALSTDGSVAYVISDGKIRTHAQVLALTTT